MAPKANMRILPIKNAATVDATAILGVREKRAKSGVKVPPEIKEPTTRLSAIVRLMVLTAVESISSPQPPMASREIAEE